MSGTVRFDFMHFMPYVHLPKNQKDYKSLWVDFPNKYYDPQKGHALYQRYLAELILADEVGFDAVVVNEQTELSATDAWQGAAVGDEAYIRLVRKVCEVKF